MGINVEIEVDTLGALRVTFTEGDSVFQMICPAKDIRSLSETLAEAATFAEAVERGENPEAPEGHKP